MPARASTAAISVLVRCRQRSPGRWSLARGSPTASGPRRTDRWSRRAPFLSFHDRRRGKLRSESTVEGSFLTVNVSLSASPATSAACAHRAGTVTSRPTQREHPHAPRAANRRRPDTARRHHLGATSATMPGFGPQGPSQRTRTRWRRIAAAKRVLIAHGAEGRVCHLRGGGAGLSSWPRAAPKWIGGPSMQQNRV